MSSALPTDFSAADLVRGIREQSVPEDLLLFAARGLLPFSHEDLVEVLVHLTGYRDPSIAATAGESLRGLPLDARRQFAADERRSGEILDRFAASTDDPAVLESLVRNRSVRDETVDRIAEVAPARLQEAIVINQARILRHPQILDALLRNPRLTADVRRRVAETREEFFEKQKPAKSREAPEEEPAVVELTAEQQQELGELLARAAEEGEPAEPTLRAPESIEDDPNPTVWTRILMMTVSEKVQCAYKGTRTERSILIQDRNKLVCTAVARNPRVSDSEAEAFAGMRNVESEVLRLIAGNREWMRKYVIMLALVRNPKAPVGSVLPLIPRLQNRDLRALTNDRNVAEAIRVSARKLFLAKTQGYQGK
ncbi:MAG TPA: hypothetical protein VM534_02345 [Thermoanaerobaculia bacterium]|nr:hypothetical protein [Thermoanaerobaculia bacterium]